MELRRNILIPRSDTAPAGALGGSGMGTKTSSSRPQRINVCACVSCQSGYNADVGKKDTYRVVEVRTDGTRVVLATGLPKATATAIRKILSTEKFATHLVIEREDDLAD